MANRAVPRRPRQRSSSEDALTGSVRRKHPSPSITESLQEYGRGIAGGLLFSVPLLYTMEVWWSGFTMPPLRQLAFVLVTFVLLLGYNRYVGLRSDWTWTEVVIDSVEELGLGLALAAAVLLVLAQITTGMTPSEVFGKVIVEGMTVAIGVSVGTAQLGGNGGDGGQGDRESEGGMHDGKREPHLAGQLVIGLCGAVLLAANIAPTEEITLLAVSATSAHLLALAIGSLGLGGLILYFSNFRGASRWARTDGPLLIAAGSAVTYTIALLASALLLWFFGRFDGSGFHLALAQTVVLGFGATLGASAGRLLLQS